MVQVFKYLNLQERIKARRVCRLWNEVANNTSIWSTTSLKVKKLSFHCCKRAIVCNKF